MTSVKNPYDSLYENLKDRFTIVYEGSDCTLGDYMLIKAGKRQTSESNLPVATGSELQRGLTTIVDYVADTLTVKKAPERERTIRRFPLRSSMSAIFTAVATCALVFSFGIFALKGTNLLAPSTAEIPTHEAADTEADTEKMPEEAK